MDRIGIFWILIFLFFEIHSSDSKSCDVEPTGKPTILESERVGSTSMKLIISLTFPGEGSNWPDCPTVPFRFRVTYAMEKSAPNTQSFDGVSNELLVTKLTSCERYNFRVAVELSDGTFSPESDANTNITDTQDPTVSPILKAIRPLTAKSFRCTWSFQEVGTNCNVNKPFDYKLYWSSTEVADTGMKPFISSITGNSIRATVDSFRPCTEYALYITVINFAGRESKPSNTLKARTLGPAPSAISTAPVLNTITMIPVDSAGKGQFYITWTFDDSQVVCAYSFVIYSKEEGSTTIKEQPIWGGAREANVTGLNTCTVHEIYIKTANLDGVLGPESNKLSERTSSGRPEIPPTLTSLTPLEDVTGKLRVAWEFDGFDGLQCDKSLGYQFTLHYSDISRGGNSTAVPIPESSKASIHVGGLRTCTEYEISISVLNAVGVESLPSSPLSQYTLSEKPDTPPQVQDVTQVQGKETELQTTWVFQGVNDLHCNPSTDYTYRIYYISDDNPDDRGNLTVTDKTLTTATITGLQQCTVYSISMSVTNVAGVESNPGSSVKQVTGSKNPTVSPKVESVVAVAGSSSQLHVSWTFDGEDELQCDPQKGYRYHIYYQSTRNPSDSGMINVTDSTSTSAIVDGLTECTTYRITMSVENFVQMESNQGSPATGTTNSKKPDTPPEITSVTRNPGSTSELTVAWKFEGTDDLHCDASLGYNFTIFYASERAPTSVMVQPVSNKLARSFVLANLTGCTEYFVTISVTNFAGLESGLSPSFRQTTGSEAPLIPPTIISITDVPDAAATATVTWLFDGTSELKCDPQKGYKYHIYYESATNPADKGVHHVTDLTAVSAVVDSLPPCTFVNFTITVSNAVDKESPPSDPVNHFTTSEKPTTPPTIRSIHRQRGSSNGLRVSWRFDPSQGLNCNPELGYDILIYTNPVDDVTQQMVTVVNDTTLTKTYVTGLVFCTLYNISITVRNAAGVESNHSESLLHVTDADDPTTPPELISVTQVVDPPTSLKVDWEFDGADDLSCAASKGYNFTIRYLPVDRHHTKKLEIDDETARSALIEELEMCTSYNVTMTVRNFVGRSSPRSASFVQVTRSEKPEIPPDVTAVAIGPNSTTSLIVDWTFNGQDNLNCDPDKGYSFIIYCIADNNDTVTKNVTDVTALTAEVTELSPCSIYTVKVTVVNFAGVESNPGASFKKMTDASKPTKVPTITSASQVPESTTQLKITWELPEPKWDWLQCDPAKYNYSFIVRYVDQDKLQNRRKRSTRDAEGFLQLPKDSLETVISDLSPCTLYSVSVSVMNFAEKESDPTSGNATTSSEKPDVVATILSLDNVGPTALHLNWRALEGLTEESLHCDPRFGYSFVISYSSLYDVTRVIEVGSNSTDLEIPNLQPCTEYNVTLAVKNRANMVGVATSTANRTGSVGSGPVLSLQFKVYGDFGIEMMWLPPATRCNVTMYKIQYTLSLFDQCQNLTPSWTEVVWTQNGTNSLSITIRDVEDFSTYDFMITPYVDGTIEGETKNASVITGEGIPDKLISINFTYGGKRRAVARWDPLECGHRRGEVWYEYKLWILGDALPEEWAVTQETVNVFKFLKRGRTYNITVRTATQKGASEELVAQVTIPEGARFIILALFIVLLLLLLLALLLFLLCRRRGRWKKYSVRRMSMPDAKAVVDQDDTDSVIYENTAFENSLVIVPAPYKQHSLSKLCAPIPMEYFPLYLRERRERDGELFQQDFEELIQPDYGNRTEASKDENRMKNRHSNLVPYDDYRVELAKCNGDSCSDYINASYIDNYEQENFYIATQGPNSVTKEDFWKMVLQEDCNTIIMLCNLVENNKVTCNRYWPKRGSKHAIFGPMTIILKQEDQRDGFVIRELTVCEEKMTKRKMTQFQYTGWPEDGVPKTSRPIWEMLELANKNKKNKKNKGPIIVHCSDGCGRTGTVIAMDALQKKYENDGKIDISDFVNKMREKRPEMVKDQAHYEFIFDAIFEKFFVRDAVLKCSTYHEMLKSWHTNRDITRLYKMLEYSSQPTLNINSCGHSPENIGKNRYQDNIPRNDFRPFLQTEVGGNSTDYINASLFNGHKEKDLFIATQDPLPHTVDDFWRLAWDYNCRTIVTLEQYDKNDATSPEYWPIKEKTEYGPFSVSPVDVHNFANGAITERLMSMSYSAKDQNEKNNLKNEIRDVKQFAIKDWPRQLHVPTSASSLLKTAELAMEWQQSLPTSKIIVHCRNGVGRSGTFIAIVNSIEQMKEKHEVNLYTIVKELRNRRPMMVDSVARFTFCYDAIDQYLQDFDTYSNY